MALPEFPLVHLGHRTGAGNAGGRVRSPDHLPAPQLAPGAAGVISAEQD
jgi:hypothetical protein